MIFITLALFHNYIIIYPSPIFYGDKIANIKNVIFFQLILYAYTHTAVITSIYTLIQFHCFLNTI